MFAQSGIGVMSFLINDKQRENCSIIPPLVYKGIDFIFVS